MDDRSPGPSRKRRRSRGRARAPRAWDASRLLALHLMGVGVADLAYLMRLTTRRVSQLLAEGRRVATAEATHGPELTQAEKAHLTRRYGRSDDPAVKAWIEGLAKGPA